MSNTQAQITGKRWDKCSVGYSGIVQDELTGDLPQKWSDMILSHAPYEGTLNILDVGTGPGFFATILSVRGHNVIGIDCAPNMLEEARRNAAVNCVTPIFEVMDNHKTTFEDNTFDMIVSRNVTWTLYDPEVAFSEWLRILKPNGRLLYFDANWDRSTWSQELATEIAEDERQYREKYGVPINTYTGDEETDNAFQSIVVLREFQRPDWDEVNLPIIGYKNLSVVNRVNEAVYDESKQLLYRHQPLFMVTADKPSGKA